MGPLFNFGDFQPFLLRVPHALTITALSQSTTAQVWDPASRVMVAGVNKDRLISIATLGMDLIFVVAR